MARRPPGAVGSSAVSANALVPVPLLALVLVPVFWLAAPVLPASADHAAFMERCAEDGMRRSLAQWGGNVSAADLPRSSRERLLSRSRELCESTYSGIDVCRAGEPERAIEKLEREIEIHEAVMSSPEMRGNDVVEMMRAAAVGESVALRDLIADRSTYCE